MTDQNQAERDADKAHMYGVSCVLTQDNPGARNRGKPEEVFEDYAADVLSEVGAQPERLYAAARVAALRSADNVEWPMLWRQAICTAELCRRAAEMASASVPSLVLTSRVRWTDQDRDSYRLS
jgi:hypothetical protein